MATTEDSKRQDDEYAAAFNEGEQPAQEQEPLPPAQEAEPPTGVESNQAESGSESSDDSPTVALVVDGDAMEEAAESAGAKESAVEAADTTTTAAIEDAAPNMLDVQKETQRLKSWEGRLKAMEAKLKAAGASTEEEQAEVVAEAIEKAADSAPTPADEEKVEAIADQVEAGEMTAEQAMKALAADFGDDFVKMIEAIATAKAKEAGMSAAGEKVAEMGKTVEEIISHINDSQSRAHFEQIASAHPDFAEVGSSEEFKAYVEGLPEGEKEQAVQIANSGSAKQIVKLLDAFKASTATAKSEPELTEAAEPIVDETELDAAEGVRSSGMRLPEQPSSSQSYEDAWNDA